MLTPGPRRRTDGAARPRGPGLRLALHRAAQVRPRGVHRRLRLGRREVEAVLHLARRRLPGDPAAPGGPNLNMRELRRARHRGRPPSGWWPWRTSAPASPAYAGEQDNDPRNAPTARPASDRGTIVHAAELQVFASDAVRPEQPGPGTGDRHGTTGSDRAPAPTTTGTGTPDRHGHRHRHRSRRTAVSLTDPSRAARPGRNAAPRLVVGVALGRRTAPEVGTAGRDRRRSEVARAVRTTTGRRTITLSRRAGPGRHTVRVPVPPDGRAAAFAPSRRSSADRRRRGG